MIKSKKLIASLMTGILVTMSFTGCQSESDKPADNNDTISDNTSSSDVISASTGEGTGYGIKEETVYVTTSADGSVEKILVSDWLKNHDNFTTLNDVTNLTDIINVKGNEEFTISDNQISFNANGNDIYYQGQLDKSTTLPVSMKITYKIDDIEVSADEINGKSGKLNMCIEYTANEKNTNDIYIPFLAVTGMLLPTNNFTNITVTNGQIVSNGDYAVVIGMGVPGIIENLDIDIPNTIEITADVNNFSLDMMMTVCTNKVFDKISIDDLNNINNLSDMINLLSESSIKLAEGADTLNNGLNMLNDNVSLLADGISKLNTGADTLENGMLALSDGANTLNNSITALYNGSVQINAGITKLSCEMNAMIETIENTITDNNIQIEELKKGISLLNAKLSATTDNTVISQLQEQLSTYNNSINQLGGANAALQSILTKLTSKDENGKTFSENLALLTQGTQNLVDGSSQLSAGATELANGSIKLSDGTTELSDGLTELNNMLPVLIDGIDKLVAGSSELNTGMSQFNENAIQAITNTYENNFSSAIDDIKALINAGKEYNTMTGLCDGTTGNCTFIIKTH